MSNPAQSNPAPSKEPPTDPKIGLMFAMSHKLAALFTNRAIGTLEAWEMAVSAIEAYRPETRADYVNIARTIAFSMAAITLLGDANANAKTLTPTEKMRLFGRAISLDRSADQSERTMMQRQRLHRANQRTDTDSTFRRDRKPQAPEPELDDATVEAAIEAAVAEAMSAFRAGSKETGADDAPTTPAAKPPAQPSAAPPKNRPGPNHIAKPPATTPSAAAAQAIAAAQAAAMTQDAAIRYDGAHPTTAQSRPVSLKQQLLAETAMQRGVDHLGPIYPGQNQPGPFPSLPAAHRPA